jgi:hypothetical protein
MINIKNYITDNTNIIEFYIMYKNAFNKNKINIFINDDLLRKITNNFKKTKENEMAYYCRNNFNYVYDLSNDSQYVYTRKLENTSIIDIDNKNNLNYYMLIFNEIKLPTHTFACTNDINSKYVSMVAEFKINNRITLIIKNNNCYIQYKHNKDVDIDKIQEIINNIIIKLNNL